MGGRENELKKKVSRRSSSSRPTCPKPKDPTTTGVLVSLGAGGGLTQGPVAPMTGAMASGLMMCLPWPKEKGIDFLGFHFF